MIHYIFYIVEREIWQLPVPSVPCIIYAPYLSRVAPGTGMSIPVPAGSFSTTTMVKESFTTGNSEVSRRDMTSNLMRWLLVDKLQGEVTQHGSEPPVKKSLVSMLGVENGEYEGAGRYRISGGGLWTDADFSEDENSASGVGAEVANQITNRGAG